ncbi:MAG: DUF262 domain-containing protein [Muribaculaceae bacterium]|nr:DUF262 domain-containing protein [Muribaculaceae bacterium]
MSVEITEKIAGKGDRTSFFKLFVENDFKIVIPMLQREYAQGRDSAKEIRTEFLKALYGYLEEKIPNRDLDFIYGNIISGEFIPLDGQQRLTTLFLLHWYLTRISKDKDLRKKFDDVLLDSQHHHCRFTYKTRTSSSEFCDAIMLNDIDFENLLEVKENGTKHQSLKKTIEDRNWFHFSWKHDPTILSMLNMLDAIHQIFYGRADFLPGLLNVETPVITFLFMELDKYQLSDELYIKMNSRGKPLTEFENFKARYSEQIAVENKSLEKPVERNLIFADGTTSTYSLDEYFSHRMDTAWTNMLWSYRNDDSKDTQKDMGEANDMRMANLARTLLSLNYIERNPQEKGGKDPVFDILVNQSGDRPLSFLILKEGDALSINSAEFLIDSMDILSVGGDKPTSCLSYEFDYYFPLQDVMQKILFNQRDLNYNDRVMLYAYLSYRLKYGKDTGINQWMRVVYNLANVENNRIDSRTEVSKSIKSVKELLNFAPDILSYLADGKRVEAFPSWLVEEERMKAILILRDEKNVWLPKLMTVEKHGYFTGQIGFILEFAGIWEAYKKDRSLKWTEEEEEVYFNRFVKYSKDAAAAFADSYEKRINDAGYRFERAVLFKGDYLPSNNAHYNLLSTNTTKNNVKRDFTWKRLLRLDAEAEATKRRSFVKEVFDDASYDYSNPVESLKKVFAGKSTGEEWRDFLIKYPKAIEYCQQGFIAFFDGIEGCEGILPMNSSRLSGYHRELYTMALDQEMEGISCKPFNKGKGYTEQKVNDALPYLRFDGLTVDNRGYWLAVSAVTDPNDWSLRYFLLELIPYHKARKEYEAVNLLNTFLFSEGFKESEEDQVLCKQIVGFNQTKIYLQDLFQKLTYLKLQNGW